MTNYGTKLVSCRLNFPVMSEYYYIQINKLLYLWLSQLEYFSVFWLLMTCLWWFLASTQQWWSICILFFLGLELPFMMMPHPLIPVSLPPASVTMAMSQMNHLSTIANMAAAAQVQSPPSRVETSVIKVTVSS